MQTVDLSGAVLSALEFLKDCFVSVVTYLNSIYILPHVTLLGFLITLAILGMIISSIFVLYDGDVDID